MTPNEIIEKKQALVQNDIDHYNKRLDELENEKALLNKKKNILQQKIGRKQIYLNQLESDKL
jgi:phage regulator Rha-like protein